MLKLADTKPSYVFCQYVNPKLTHEGRHCMCFDIVRPKVKPQTQTTQPTKSLTQDST